MPCTEAGQTVRCKAIVNRSSDLPKAAVRRQRYGSDRGFCHPRRQFSANARIYPVARLVPTGARSLRRWLDLDGSHSRRKLSENPCPGGPDSPPPVFKKI